jgi:hypothetical protein
MDTQSDPYITKTGVLPELLDQICGSLGRADCVQVSYASRLFFQVAVPHVWRELRGANNLLSLIQGVECVQDLGNQKSIVSTLDNR